MSTSFTEMECDLKAMRKLFDEMALNDRCYYVSSTLIIIPAVIQLIRWYPDRFPPSGTVLFQFIQSSGERSPTFVRDIAMDKTQMFYRTRKCAGDAVVLAKLTGKFPTVRDSL